MNYLCLLTLLTLSLNSVAQGLRLDELGALDLQFEAAQRNELLAGNSTLAVMQAKPGQAYSLFAPTRIEQVDYLFEPGQLVSKGQHFATIRGPEMHHFLEEYAAVRKLYETARKRLVSGELLHDKKAISEEQWFEINQAYYKAHLDYEHMRHFAQLVQSADEESETIELTAPATGLINYQSARSGIRQGDSLVEFIPTQAIRLRLKLPAGQSPSPVMLRTASCDIAIESVGQLADGFFVSAWSEAPSTACHLHIGQKTSATPYYPRINYRVPRNAVFRLEGSSHVLLRIGNRLETLQVNVLGSNSDSLFLADNEALENNPVLISSVSAIQGIALGLGNE